jgi:hypothetical protein
VGVERDAPKKSKREGGWGDGIGTESRRRRLGWLVRPLMCCPGIGRERRFFCILAFFK